MTTIMKPKNIAAQAFPEQFRRLRPEQGKAGGVKARSGSEARRMEVYGAIKELFLRTKPPCGCFGELAGCEIVPSDIHHRAGRAGILLFDTRTWMAVCRPCHEWIHAHPAEARRQGWLWKGVE